MRLYESLVRPLAFLLEPETAHNLALSLISKGFVRTRALEDPRLRQTLFGVDFPNPLGLAAGFDKNAVAIDRWPGLGFGFAELGTITLHPQPGNPRPRLFRLPQHKALINRMGFNNDGAEAIANRLATGTAEFIPLPEPIPNASRPQSPTANPAQDPAPSSPDTQPPSSPGTQPPRSPFPLGLNLGKSKITEIEKAAEDYRESFRLLRSFGAYFVVNVSSPNTPGLRTLQERGPLTEIVQAIKSVDPDARLFVKVAPDLEIPALDEVVEVAHTEKLTGLIATNTTLSREDITGPHAGEAGGLSGAPLRSRSNQLLSHLYRTCDKNLILMGVGGIFTGADVYEKIKLGAHLCQVYTGWVYGGPSSVPRMLRELTQLMERDGIESVSQLRGTAS